MTLQDCTDIVEKLLRQNNRTFKDSHEELLYDRGYLTGVIARMMLENPMIRTELIERIKKHWLAESIGIEPMHRYSQWRISNPLY